MPPCLFVCLLYSSLYVVFLTLYRYKALYKLLILIPILIPVLMIFTVDIWLVLKIVGSFVCLLFKLFSPYPSFNGSTSTAFVIYW